METRINKVNMYKPLVVVPLYNHLKTLPTVINDIKKYFTDILIVDDGSTDNSKEVLSGLNINYITHKKNQGKGQAVLTAVKYAKEKNFTHILTIDADGQHYAKDLYKLSKIAEQTVNSIVIGKRNFDTDNVPASSKFGRKFSSFWARVQTGKKIVDIQSGLRVYPLIIFDCLKFLDKRYSFEVEVIIKSVWAGFSVIEEDVDVKYYRAQDRVSHFNFITDNFRLSILNTKLTIRAMIPYPHKKYVVSKDNKIVSLNPFKVVKSELKKNKSPYNLGISAVWAVFWGSIALPGIRTIILLFGMGYFNLNRPICLTLDKLAIAPFIPAIAIEVGFFIRHGKWLTEFNLTTLGYQAPQRIWEWFLGSLFVAPVFALLVGLIVFILGKLVRRGLILSGR